MMGMGSRRVRLVLALGVSSAVYGLMVRPWMLDWGATDDERARPLPGDDIMPAALPEGTYAFILEPIDDDTTRFIVRDRALWKRREYAFAAAVYEPLHAYMETGLILGVKQRAEKPAA